MRDTFAISVPSSKHCAVRATKWAVLHRDRQIPHLQRKLYHLAMGLVCFSLYAVFLTRGQALALLVGVGGLFVALDSLRLFSAHWNKLALKWFGGLMRREELNRLSANSFYVFGLLVVTLFFPKPVVLLSVLYLALGDPVAAVVGTRYGRHKILGKKSWEGTLANYAASALGTLFVGVVFFHLGGPRALALGLVGGVISAVAELVPLPVNDNFSIPVISAICLTGLAEILPFF